MVLVAIVFRITASAYSLRFSIDVYQDSISTQLTDLDYNERINGIQLCMVLYCLSLMLVFYSVVKYFYLFYYSRGEKETSIIRWNIIFFSARTSIYEFAGQILIICLQHDLEMLIDIKASENTSEALYAMCIITSVLVILINIFEILGPIYYWNKTAVEEDQIGLRKIYGKDDDIFFKHICTREFL